MGGGVRLQEEEEKEEECDCVITWLEKKRRGEKKLGLICWNRAGAKVQPPRFHISHFGERTHGWDGHHRVRARVHPPTHPHNSHRKRAPGARATSLLRAELL